MPVDIVFDDDLLEYFRKYEGEFPNSIQMPGTRVQEGWMVVNMLMIKPEDKNNVFVSLKQDAADIGWTVRKFDIPLSWNAVKALLRNAAPKTLFTFMWHSPTLVVQRRQNGTIVYKGTDEEGNPIPKKVAPVYDITPDWFIEFLADVVVGGTPENPVMGRPTDVPQLNRWVHQEDFSSLPDEVDEIVANSTPDS